MLSSKIGSNNSLTVMYLLLFLNNFMPSRDVNACVLNNGVGIITASFEVSEITAIGNLAYNFTITNSSKSPFITNPEQNYFELFNFEGPNYGLRLTKTLLPSNVVDVVKICCEQSTTATFFTIYANIIDVDNNAPTFASPYYTYTISEQLTIVGYSLPDPKPRWSDLDNSRVQKIETAIVPKIFNGSYFEIVSNTSITVDIKLIKKLDFEESPMYKLMIKAIDTDSNTNQVMFETNTTITIYLSDVDDEPPVFTAPAYTALIFSNATKGAQIFTKPSNLSAFDGDISINAKLTYSISGAPDTFAIDNSTGWITLLMDNPPVKTHDLTVTAVQVDNKDRFSFVKLEIKVQAGSNTPPKFSQEFYRFLVSELHPIENAVATVAAYDTTNSGLIYSVKSFYDTFYFRSPKIGELFLLRPIDYETNYFYNISISVSDGEWEVNNWIYLSVLNENDNNPVFQFRAGETKYSFSIKREQYATVGKILAIDPDNDTVLYKLLNFQTLFNINETSGLIVLIGQFQDLTESAYGLKIEASDTMKPIRQQSALVDVMFTDAAASVITASMQIWPFIIIGVVLALIVIFSVAGALCLNKRSQNQRGKTSNGRANSINSFEANGSTSLQKNPIEGFNNFYYGDNDELDMHMYGADRDVTEIRLDDNINEILDFSTCETISSASVSGSHQNLIGGNNGTTLPIKTQHNNMELVQAENAIDASSVTNGNQQSDIIIYF